MERTLSTLEKFRRSNQVPRVSIGLPVYNGERYLPQALDSLLAQTYKDFELIISDNGSTDGTASICRAYAACDKRIRYYREDVNHGASWNFNRVFEFSRAEYFKWAASDDICKPTFIFRCVEVLDRDPSIVCCHAKTGKIDQWANVLTHLPDPTDGGLPPDTRTRRRDASSHRAHWRFHDVLLSIGWSARSYAVIRVDALRRTGLIKPYYGYEKVMMAELSLLGRFHDVRETLFYQRVHAEASSTLASAAEQQAFFDPALVDRRTYPRLQLLSGYVTALWRFPLGPYDRLCCFLWIGKYLCQVKKWKRVILSLYRGTGADDANREILEQLGQK